MRDAEVGIETLKLLVQVAWADHEVSDAEIDYVLGMAGQVGASEQDTEMLRQSLRDEGCLPAPNLGLLRKYRDDVLAAVDTLIGIDDQIVEDEVSTREEIATLLGAS
jgi:hypothetical protein